jgi:hypothetical protein
VLHVVCLLDLLLPRFDGAMGLLLAISAVKAVHLEALKRANKLSMLRS